jgi:hypothetical protein
MRIVQLLAGSTTTQSCNDVFNPVDILIETSHDRAFGECGTWSQQQWSTISNARRVRMHAAHPKKREHLEIRTDEISRLISAVLYVLFMYFLKFE